MSWEEKKQTYFTLMSISIINAVVFLAGGFLLIIGSIFLGLSQRPLQSTTFGIVFLFIGTPMLGYSRWLFKNKNK